MGRRIFEDLPSETREYQKNAMRAARQLYYGEDVICKLKRAKTVGEIVRIMATARKAEDDDTLSKVK